jgi:hypothetical protein
MNRPFKSVVILVVAVCLGLAATVSVNAAGYYTYGIYRYYWTTTAQYNLARAIAPYGYEAKRAALVSMGGRNVYTGYVDVAFYSQNSNTLGYTYGGTKLWLNMYHNKTGGFWGSVLAHETSHIYFFQYTNANYWNSSMRSYIDFITESMAFYAGDMVYAYGNRYSASTVKANLKYYASYTKSVVSFYGTGYYYRYGGTNFNQSWWQLHAQGYYFANGYTSSYYSRLSNLMYYFRNFSQNSGYYLRSSTFNTARYYFENCFYLAYGKRANADWSLTGSANGAYKNTAFLYGDFWYKWYN